MDFFFRLCERVIVDLKSILMHAYTTQLIVSRPKMTKGCTHSCLCMIQSREKNKIDFDTNQNRVRCKRRDDDKHTRSFKYQTNKRFMCAHDEFTLIELIFIIIKIDFSRFFPPSVERFFFFQFFNA